MADISKEVQQLMEAKYGEEVRGAFKSCMEKINNDNESYQAIKDSVKASENTIKQYVDAFDTKSVETEGNLRQLTAKIGEAQKTQTDLQNSESLAKQTQVSLSKKIQEATDTGTTLSGITEIAQKEKSSLDQSITDGTTAKNELQQKIAEAGKLSADMMEAKNNLAGLTEKNAEAVRNIDALDAKIKTAGSSGTLLEKQIQAADAVNTTLEGTIRTADTSKTALENATVVAGDTKQLLSQKITEARSTIDDITAAKGSLAQAGFEAQKVVETVNQSAQNATAAKAALDNTIKSSAESKAALAGSITESGVAINKVNDAIRAAGVAVEETVAATNETKKTTEEAKNADTKLSQSASDANALKTALDAVVGSVAQNATAEEIARILQTNSTLLAQIAESAGKAGSLNGFGLNLLQDGSVSLTYSNPDTGELQGSAIFPKESTLSALDQALAEMNVSLKKIAISKGGTV